MIRIKEAVASDCLDITRLFEELIAEITERTETQTPLFTISDTAGKCRTYLESGIYKVWLGTDETCGRAAGFLSMCESHSLYANGAFGIIQELYVRPKYRSQGVGARLLLSAKAYGIRQGWKRLEVVTPPLPAFERTVGFYERNGFQLTGGRKLKSIIL